MTYLFISKALNTVSGPHHQYKLLQIAAKLGHEYANNYEQEKLKLVLGEKLPKYINDKFVNVKQGDIDDIRNRYLCCKASL